VRTRLVKVRGWAWKLAVPAVAAAAAAQLALAGSAAATHTRAVAHHAAGVIVPQKTNMLDCNNFSPKYKSAAPSMRAHCTDPARRYLGKYSRFYENGHYIGHDEPSVKFISSLAGSGNTMTYGMRLPHDPKKAATSTGSVTKYGELSVAPWFGLPMCDPRSFPQAACKADSDSNNPNGAGSAFMELQFYAPGFTPFFDNVSCDATKWCAALTIDSLECDGAGNCNNNCIEPVNFAFLQTNGVPAGSPAPQNPSTKTFLGNGNTLKMNAGDVLKVAITDPSAGFTARITDLTTHKSGFMTASAKNGFANTSMADCSGHPFTWHAEYSTAKKQNQVPWAALEGGVLMQQEIGHGEACASALSKETVSQALSNGTFKDPNVFQVCSGGMEGKGKRGEGPCNVQTGTCQGSETQGPTGPVPCTAASTNCEFSDGFCFMKGTRTVTIAGKAVKETQAVTQCSQNQFENGDADFDGTSYRADWPNGSANFPEAFRYVGPTTKGHTYSSIQFESNVGASENLCNTTTGASCTTPPIGAKFYPFFTLNNKQALTGITGAGACVWNFGNVINGVTMKNFGKAKEYGTPDVARFGGTQTSKVMSNPAIAKGCKAVHL
jgi:hypothetical protein